MKNDQKKDNRKENKKDEAKFAPGLDDDEELREKATEEEIKAGDSTEVTHLSYDEVDPS